MACEAEGDIGPVAIAVAIPATRLAYVEESSVVCVHVFAYAAFLPLGLASGVTIPSSDDVFGPAPRISAPSSPNLVPSTPNLNDQRDSDGCLISEQLAWPVVDDLRILFQALRSRLEAMASEPRTKRQVDRQVLIDVVLDLCEARFITLSCLAELVNRKPDTLRDQYLKVLVRQRQLSLAFPKTPNHERQAYTTVKPCTP